MTGTHDHLVRPKNSYILKEILEPEVFKVFQDAGHGIHLECFKEFNEEVMKICKIGMERMQANNEQGIS
jgi:pimeloyl-ACP methyl ester carboxylesterase